MPSRKTLKLEISASAKDDLRDVAQYTFVCYGEQQADIYFPSFGYKPPTLVGKGGL